MFHKTQEMGFHVVYEAVILAVPHRSFLEHGWPAVHRVLTSDDSGVFGAIKGMCHGEVQGGWVLYGYIGVCEDESV